jgi:Tfp pilus assembly protein FimV
MEKYLALFAAILFAALMCLPIAVSAEPIVVLKYRNTAGSGDTESGNTHPFRMDPGYGTKHKVRQDETLSHIITNYYGGSGIDASFVQMAILRRNKSAFVRSNPNYLYAGKTLYLPSLNDIRAMITGGGRTHGSDSSSSRDGYVRNEIFFFGG